MKPEDVVKIMNDGSAEDYLRRFIEETLKAQYVALGEAGTIAPEAEDAFVAAMCLASVLDVSATRRALNLKRSPRGKSFDPWELASRSPGVMQTAALFHLNKIDKTAALSALSIAAEDVFGSPPENQKTLESMLQALSVEASQNAELYAAGIFMGGATIAFISLDGEKADDDNGAVDMNGGQQGGR